LQRHEVTLKWIGVSDVHIASIIRPVMEAVRTSETSVYSNETTRRYIPEGSKLRIRCGENLKSHMYEQLLWIYVSLEKAISVFKN
jgi:hypothetical protein